MKHRTTAHRASERESGEAMPLLFPVLKALLIGAAAFAVLTLLAALYAYSQDNPDGVLTAPGMAVPALGALVCGFAAAKLAGERPLACGLWSGAAYTLLLLLLRLVFTGGRESFGLAASLGMYAGMLALAVLGALIGGRRTTPARGRKKRLKKYAQ